MILYVVKMKFKTGTNIGFVHNHSVWFDKNKAERQIEIRNKHNGQDCTYWLEETVDYIFGKNLWNRKCVKLPSSIGWMEVMC